MSFPSKRKPATFAADMACIECGCHCERKSAAQKYCPECSEKKSRERGAKWFRENRPNQKPRDTRRRQSDVTRRGIDISDAERQNTAEWICRDVNLSWLVRVAVPFDWAASKNHMFTFRGNGHVALRKGAKSYREGIALAIKSALRGQRVANNKVWLDIYIQKPNNRGDAANFVDLICDAVKDAIGVDDRWFSIRRLDWQIVKSDPHIYIGIGQEEVEDAQACSSCGRILPLESFWRTKGNKSGRTRNCVDCSSSKPRLRIEIDERLA